MGDRESQEGSQDAGDEHPTDDEQHTHDEQPTGTQASQERIEKMEHGIDRVGHEIKDAEKDARDAAALDPQPLAGTAGTASEPAATEGEPDSRD
jgi:hypothetical protein